MNLSVANIDNVYKELEKKTNKFQVNKTPNIHSTFELENVRINKEEKKKERHTTTVITNMQSVGQGKTKFCLKTKIWLL